MTDYPTISPPSRNRLLHWTLLPVLLLAAFAIFSPLLSAPFLYDDETVIVRDPAIVDALAADAPVPLFRDLARMPRPLRQFTHRLDARLYGLVPRPAHAVNIVLHALAAFAAAGLLLSIGLSLPRAAFAAAFFLIAPVTLESVAVVSHRKELLSALFLFLALALPPRLRFAPLAALGFALAALAKETALVFPGLLLAVSAARRLAPSRHASSPPLRPRAFAAWLLFAAVLALALLAQARAAMDFLQADPAFDTHRAGHFGHGAPWTLAVSAALRAFPRCLRALADPFAPHSVDPAFPLDVPLLSLPALLSLLLLLLFLAALWFSRRTRLFPPLLWMAVSLAPYLFPPLLRSGGTAAFADRYLYLASFGFAWLLAAIPPVPLPRRPRLLRPALVLLAAALLALAAVPTRRLALRCVTNVDFWTHAVALNPASATACCNLAHAYWQERLDAPAAAAQYDRMLALAPDFVFGVASRAAFLAAADGPEAADDALTDALARPFPPRARALLLSRRAAHRLEAARGDDALADYESAIALGLASPDVLRGHAEALKRTLRWPEALREINAAAALDPAYRPEADAFRVLLEDPPLRPSRAVLLLGDSVPAGLHSAPPGAPVRSLAARLAKLRPDLAFLDETLPGSSAAGLARGFPRVARRHPDAAWCLILTGHNDAFAGAPPREILFALSGCVAAARRAGLRPLLLGPIPVRSTPDRDRTAQDAALAELDRLLDPFCASANVPYLSLRNAFDIPHPEESPVLVPEDGNHLTDRGMDLLAETATRILPKP